MSHLESIRGKQDSGLKKLTRFASHYHGSRGKYADDERNRGKHASAAPAAVVSTAAVSCQRCLTAESPPTVGPRPPKGDMNHRQKSGDGGDDEPCEVCCKLRTLSGMVPAATAVDAPPHHIEGQSEVSWTGEDGSYESKMIAKIENLQPVKIADVTDYVQGDQSGGEPGLG